MDFYFNTKIISLQDPIYVREMKNKEYIVLLKYIQNGDKKIIAEFFDNWLHNNLKYPELLMEMTALDKFIILLDVRSICLGNTLKCNSNEHNISYDLGSIINTLQSNCKNYKRLHEYKLYNIELNVPQSLYIADNNIINSAIYSIIPHSSNDNKLFSALSSAEQLLLMSHLPGNIVNDIIDYIKYVSDLTININVLPGSETLNIKSTPLSLFNNFMLEYLCEIYKDDLTNIYRMIYYFSSKLNCGDVMEMTPNEGKLLLNLYNEDVKNQEEEMEKRSKAGK